MGLVQSCLGKKNKVGVMPEEEVEAYKRIDLEKEVREAEEENPTMEPVHRVEQSTHTSAQTSAATDVAKTVFHSSVPKLPPIFTTNYELEEQQDSALEQEMKAVQRPKAAKSKRTVHVAFSDNIS